MRIQNNIQALNTMRNYQLSLKEKTKSANKLSSGYRINMAADDAAGLTISEQMREQIRGLNKGTQNAEDGISYIQTGEGALNEVQSILHRMNEITIQSLNDTNTQSDRAALQAEFDELQCEIDNILDNTHFNTKNIFSEHEPTYTQLEGNLTWNQNGVHIIDDSINKLVINYRKDETTPVKQISIEVPEGEYTTQELVDEIEDALIDSGATEEGFSLEYTDDGTCNLNFEDGKFVDSIAGGLSYLINDVYNGGSVGALIGTTSFKYEDAPMKIATGYNDTLSFDIQSFDGSVKTKSITIPQGGYTRQQMIDFLNSNLADTSVEAVKYGKGIKLQSNDSIITGFKGNMFKIDTDNNNIYSSVFYDNVMYGSATLKEASFTGGAVITTSSKDEEFNHYTIGSSNNQLTITANTGSPVTITIPEGRYSVDEMVNLLNNEFVNNSMALYASKITSSNFEGIKITSNIKGLTSKVDVDSSSSAYNTLFEKSEYTNFGSKATVDSETNSNSTGSIVGGKKIEGNNLPIKIEAGKNDSFSLEIKTSINGTEMSSTYTITLDEGDYTTSTQLLSHINDKLNGSSALAGYKDKIDVSYASGNKISFKGREGSNITSVKVNGVTGNTGYEELFVGKTVTTQVVKVSDKGTETTPATITLNQSIPDPVKITSDNNKLVINQNNNLREIILPTGDEVTHDKIIEAINTQAKEEVYTTENRFADSKALGTTKDNKVKAYGKGSTNESPGDYSAIGKSQEDQGNVGNYVYNNPAKVTMSVKVPSTFKVDSSNNIFTININGVKKTLMLDEGTYSQSQLVNELQKKIDNNFGTKAGGAVVSINDSKLVFTARLNKNTFEEIDAKNTSISFAKSSSSFIRSLHTTKGSAVATSDKELESSITINDDNNSFVFQYDGGSGSYSSINLVLSNGTYTRQGLINEINNQLNKANVPVNAKLYNNKLQLISDGVGSEYRISYDNFNGGTSAEALFGDYYIHTPAIATIGGKVLDNFVIDDTTKGFNITINNVNHSIELATGNYTPDKLVNELNSKLNDKGVKVSLDNGKLRYETIAAGSSQSFKVSYDTGGSSMIRIYGEKTTVVTGITATFNSNNELVLTSTRTGSGQSLEVSSDKGGIFQKSIENTKYNGPDPTVGYVSNKHAFIDGVNISEPIKITEWNKALSFKYTANGVSTNINLTLDEKDDYTYEEIVTALQDKINQIIPAGELIVSANSNGIRIETTGVGNKYKLSDFSGGMYYHVLCNSSKVSSNKSTDSLDGIQNVNPAFTVGRRDVKNESVEIENNINDVFTFDLRYGNTTKTFSVKLDAGDYSGKSLSNEIQKKLDEELQKQGFPAKMIEVGIGGVSTGVSGSNDSNALVLKMSKTVPLPADGEYVLDGVRGSAAFSIFYQSDGKMVPAYAKGTKDISEGLEITSENNELAFDVDGTNYSITLSEGEYTGEELINEINNKLNGSGAPVVAKMDDNSLRLSYTSYGEHIIDNFSGSAKSDLFFQENGAEGEKEVIHIQLSSRGGEENPDGSGSRIGQDATVIDKFVLNTVSLGINSITISKPKYANKALGRLAKANEMVSEIRSYFGATQNRLESSIRGNDNTSENTQAAESGIRDVDMADEMVKNSKYSILQQAAQAVLAQANSSAEGILTLLK